MSDSKALSPFPPSFGDLLEALSQHIRHRPASLERVSARHEPLLAPDLADLAAKGLVARADEAASFLKTLGHEGRLAILCHLCGGEKSVTELEILISSRQSVVSQQLARLRFEGLVQARREGQAIYYSILDPKVIDAVALLAMLYRDPAEGQTQE